MKKKFLGVILVMILGTGMCACGSAQDMPVEASAETSEDLADVEAAPGTLSASEVAVQATATPEVTETPKATVTPEATATLKATATPEVTETPKVTATPQATETPKATATPQATAAPQVAATPQATAAPQAAATPQATAAPTSTPTPVHTHTFVDKTVSEATCTEAKVVESVCSVCGASGGSKTEGSALGHDMYEDWFNAPGCTNGGWVTERCRRCDYASGHEGTSLGHDWREESTTGPDCQTSGVTTQVCNRCGATGGSWENGQCGDHNWVTFTQTKTIVDESAPEGQRIQTVTTEVTQCSYCSAIQ